MEVETFWRQPHEFLRLDRRRTLCHWSVAVACIRSVLPCGGFLPFGRSGQTGANEWRKCEDRSPAQTSRNAEGGELHPQRHGPSAEGSRRIDAEEMGGDERGDQDGH